MIIESLLAVLGTLVATYIWERKIRDRINIHRIHSSEDETATGVIELYTNIFQDDGTNYSADEITDMLTDFKGDRHVASENIILAALYHNNVVGFIFCHYYKDRQKAIISYFGIDKQIIEARRTAAKKLLNKLVELLTDRKHPCEYIFYDLQRPNQTLSANENSERKARPVLFRQTAKSLGRKAYVVNIDYESPKISLTDEAYEQPLILMFVKLNGEMKKRINKDIVMEFLRFMYIDCYGDIYPITDERFQLYHNHLNAKLKEYDNILPNDIKIT